MEEMDIVELQSFSLTDYCKRVIIGEYSDIANCKVENCEICPYKDTIKKIMSLHSKQLDDESLMRCYEEEARGYEMEKNRLVSKLQHDIIVLSEVSHSPIEDDGRDD